MNLFYCPEADGLGVGEGDPLGEAEALGLGDGEDEAEGEGVGLGEGDAVGVALGFIEGFGVALIVGLTEGFKLGDGEGVGVSVGVGVGEGLGELVSFTTSVLEGRKIDFRNMPEPTKIARKTIKRINVGREGLVIAIKNLSAL